MKVAVFTARIGEDTDPLREPRVVAPGVKYFCASDRAIQAGSAWQRIGVRVTESPVMAARWFKLNLHVVAAPFDVAIWLDAAFELVVDPRELVAPVLRGDIALFAHPDRTTVAEEGAAVVQRGFATATQVDPQLAHYAARGCPAGPLSATGLLVRRGDDRTRDFNSLWWRELRRWGHPRDQVSVDYALWRAHMRVSVLPGHYRQNDYAIWYPQPRKEKTNWKAQ